MSERLTMKKIWDNAKRWPVPWDRRTYGLVLEQGRPCVLHEGWEHKMSADGQATALIKVPNSLDNPWGYPVMTYEQLAKVYAVAEQEKIAFKVAFLKVMGADKLTRNQLETLANSPEVFIVGDAVPVEEKARDTERNVEALLAASKADAKPKKVASSL